MSTPATRPSIHTAASMTPISRRLVFAGGLAGVASVALAGTALADSSRSAFPDRIELPANFQPEGITIGPRSRAYFGSRRNGDILAADLRTGQTRIISEGPGTASVGLKIDRRGRLFVAGGPAGTLRVIDSATGELLKTYSLSQGESFINDVLIAGDTIWVTDSPQATLYRIDLGKGGALPADAVGLPLAGDWVQAPSGSNSANGLTDTRDGSAIMVINSFNGTLYRVDPATGVTAAVDLGGELMTNGDGLLRHEDTLYVVQNRLNQVAVLTMAADGATGELQQLLTSDDFDIPTTVAKLGNSLYLPNARFSTTPTDTTEYWVTRISAR